ncbi:hypothetical protein [Mesorhizobium xinjiangense]|nr:hypothetical protein [Mesorhizobium xinjiangense]
MEQYYAVAMAIGCCPAVTPFFTLDAYRSPYVMEQAIVSLISQAATAA